MLFIIKCEKLRSVFRLYHFMLQIDVIKHHLSQRIQFKDLIKVIILKISAVWVFTYDVKITTITKETRIFCYCEIALQFQATWLTQACAYAYN